MQTHQWNVQLLDGSIGDPPLFDAKSSLANFQQALAIVQDPYTNTQIILIII